MRGDAGTEGSQGQERELLPGRRDRALAPAVVETCATGTSARKARRIAERMGVGRLSKDQAGAIARSLDADAAEPLGRDLSGYRISNPKSFGAQTRNSEAIKHSIDAQDVLTDPKTPKSKRIIAMPRFDAEEMEAFLSGFGLDPDERIFPVTKHFLNHEMARMYRELRRIWSAGEVDEGLAWTIDFLAREFFAMHGREEPSDVEREDALIFGMSRR